MNQKERLDKIKELQKRNQKSPEFLKRMKYIQARNFTVRRTSDPPGYDVTVTLKNEK